MSQRRVSRVEFEGPAGRLEGLLHVAGSAPRFAAVASHPHPLHGGTMDNKVIYRTARGLEDAGGLVLRFNFRGAGASEGAHDAGRGEQDDLVAALRFLRESGGEGLPLLLAGFSFGSVMSARVAVADPSVESLLLVGAPVATHALSELAGFERPVAFVHGDRDEHGPLELLERLAASVRGPCAVRIVAGAGHFFDGRLPELQALVAELASSGALGPRLAAAER